jgi:SAM-dependent methyltransferase
MFSQILRKINFDISLIKKNFFIKFNIFLKFIFNNSTFFETKQYDELKLSAGNLKDSSIHGGASKDGYLYHAYPKLFLNPGIKFHRGKTNVRIRKILSTTGITDKRILDIGCANGGLSFLLEREGGSVIGIDVDKQAIQIANIYKKIYSNLKTNFELSDVVTFKPQKTDLIVWLSSWMWVEKKYGFHKARELLFLIPKNSTANEMIFESAANDGKAKVEGRTQKYLKRMIYEYSPFEGINNLGPFEDGWRIKTKKRNVFHLTRPNFSWKGKQSFIERVGPFTIEKRYDPSAIWAVKNEIRALKKLQKYKCFPKLIRYDDYSITMSFVGKHPEKIVVKTQLINIIDILIKEKIFHRDINLKNLFQLEGNLFLIDFEWSIIDGVFNGPSPKSTLGRGFYSRDDKDDMSAAKKVIASL